MPWLSIDDRFHANPKILSAGNAAVGLYIRCASYCADQLTDGFIPEHVARLYGTKREIGALLASHPPYGPLWVTTEGGYSIPDYLDYNPTRDEVTADRASKHEAKVAAGRAGGIASGIARRKHNPSKHEANGEANTKRNEAPTRPLPKEEPLHPKDDVTTERPQPVDISGWADRRRAP